MTDYQTNHHSRDRSRRRSHAAVRGAASAPAPARRSRSVRTTESAYTPAGPGGATTAARIVTFAFGVLQALLHPAHRPAPARREPGQRPRRRDLRDHPAVRRAVHRHVLADRVDGRPGSVLDVAAIVALIGWTLVEALILAGCGSSRAVRPRRSDPLTHELGLGTEYQPTQLARPGGGPASCLRDSRPVHSPRMRLDGVRTRLELSSRVVRAVLRSPALRRVEIAFLLFNAAEFGTWVAILLFAYAATGPAPAWASSPWPSCCPPRSSRRSPRTSATVSSRERVLFVGLHRPGGRVRRDDGRDGRRGSGRVRLPLARQRSRHR